MNKKVLATAGIAAIAISGTAVKADEAVASEQVSTAASTSVGVNQKVPTQAQVNEAKAQANQASQAVTQQEAVVANQEAAVNQAQANLATADTNLTQAQTVANEASPENIENAQNQVTSAENGLESAKAELETAKSEEQAAGDAVSKQEEQVKADEAEVAAKTTEVSVAQKAVDDAKAVLNGSADAEAITNKNKAQAAFDAAQAAEREAKSDLASAQTADSELAKTIKTKETQVAADQQAVNAAKAAMDSAQVAANEKASALAAAADAKAKADAANVTKDTAKAKQVFKVTYEYVNALKTYESATATAAEKAQAEQTLRAINKRERDSNTFQANEADKSVVINDLNNMSEEQLTDLSLYASSLINQVRTAFGTTQTSVSKSSVVAADRVAEGYVADNWGWDAISRNQHNDAALDRVGKSFHEVSIGENLNTWKGLTGPMSLNDVKGYIFEAMLDFMFNGEEWNHARSIAGIPADGGEAYVGASISVVADAFNVHVNNVNKNYLKSGNNFDTTKLANPYESASQSRSVASPDQAAATAAYNAAKTANDQAQSDLTAKKAAYQTATVKLNQSKADLDNLKSTPSRLTSAQATLNDKQAALATAKAELDKANAVVENLNASVKAKNESLTKAEANLSQKAAALQAAQNQLTASRGTLQRLTNAYKVAQEATASKQAALTQASQFLSAAQARLQELTMAPTTLAKAQSDRAAAQVSLTSAQASLADERAKLEELLAERERLTNEYGVVQTALDVYLKAKAEEEQKLALADDLARINARGGTAVPVYDDFGNLIAFVAQEDPNQVTGTVKVSYGNVSNKSAGRGDQSTKNLPQTGEATNVASALSFAGFFMTLLGFLGFANKRARRN